MVFPVLFAISLIRTIWLLTFPDSGNVGLTKHYRIPHLSELYLMDRQNCFNDQSSLSPDKATSKSIVYIISGFCRKHFPIIVIDRVECSSIGWYRVYSKRVSGVIITIRLEGSGHLFT